MGIQPLEVTDDICGTGGNGKYLGAGFNNFGQQRKLRIVYDAEQKSGLFPDVNTLSWDQGRTVPEARDDLLGDFLRIVRDDLTADGGAFAFQDFGDTSIDVTVKTKTASARQGTQTQ